MYLLSQIKNFFLYSQINRPHRVSKQRHITCQSTLTFENAVSGSICSQSYSGGRLLRNEELFPLSLAFSKGPYYRNYTMTVDDSQLPILSIKYYKGGTNAGNANGKGWFLDIPVIDNSAIVSISY